MAKGQQKSSGAMHRDPGCLCLLFRAPSSGLWYRLALLRHSVNHFCLGDDDLCLLSGLECRLSLGMHLLPHVGSLFVLLLK